ncbi:L-threonylcarbamoyladenylate synthase [Aquabacterium sp. A7-Y]|uniref:L-threonylcarbamoyladenylate synthase n=1 Tax=Aquabacterium sp. A7-Y TaxID=1349605 RepID=UPI00223D2A33|nr:L-threonylcarbamoyladenylate synthase [Aquabacterium sp. A7-Y]MCW7539090.1 L-threonylcarbamoyladenylate synthase [Aquabacterium sp. A7-Y]
MARQLDGHDPQQLQQAVDALCAGRLVAFPTETVYGLGANAGDDAAVRGIFAAKGRPADHPLIVHLPNMESSYALAAAVPPAAQKLMSAFWPGPLTVIVPRREGVATAAAGGLQTIGLRCPAHPVAHALLDACAQRGLLGLAGPSANLFGRVSPTTAAHVVGEFGDEVLVLDGGACQVGIESTIIDCSREHPVLLRPGMITRAEIEAVLEETLLDRDEHAPRAPGTLEAHYAPRATVRLMSADILQTALQVLGTGAPKLALYSRTVRAPRGMPHRRMPDDAAQAAQELFAALREFDALGVELIWVESPPPAPEWDGVRDRLARAAAS